MRRRRRPAEPANVEIVKTPPQFKPPEYIRESQLRRQITDLQRFLHESAALIGRLRHEPKTQETLYVNGRLLAEAEARVKKARKGLLELGVSFNNEGLV